MRNIRILIKLGTIILILISAGSSLKGQSLKKVFKQEVSAAFVFASTMPSGILSWNDVEGLPEIVQKYLKYTGSVGEDKIVNFTVAAMGEAKMARKLSWINFTSQQYNFLEVIMKIFYLESNRMGFSKKGVLSYKDASATLIGDMSYIFDYPGGNSLELSKSELANYLIDLCLHAPGSLTDKRITWEEIDNRTAVASMVNDNIKVSLSLMFNEKGQLMQLRTDDHYEHVGDRDVERISLSVIVEDYKNYGRFLLPSRAKVISHRDKEDFEFMRYDVIDIRYNVKK